MNLFGELSRLALDDRYCRSNWVKAGNDRGLIGLVHDRHAAVVVLSVTFRRKSRLARFVPRGKVRPENDQKGSVVCADVRSSATA